MVISSWILEAKKTEQPGGQAQKCTKKKEWLGLGKAESISRCSEDLAHTMQA